MTLGTYDDIYSSASSQGFDTYDRTCISSPFKHAFIPI